MKMRLVLLVVGLLIAGVLVACGGDDENSGGGGGGGDTSAQTETGGGGGGGAETGGDTGGGNASDPQVKQAIEACEQQINAQPNVSEDVKSDLTELCQKAASGDQQEVREATKEVCLKLVEETTKNLPPGAGDQATEQAKAACNQATATP